eukprot:CAMPEP_0113702648 /NCGR_PEP_ID=MMETSP0038_2-20120614/25332_1 /TAXON_ID=2898 /ORGANISM="Cryptomonas paramecium" /LENGTH=217 /DNA_ID=CAMNT_0000626845 /DNA_START=241 /DNA_END=892 /DNA_ORIENTATION=+ /assembly_acc=CAM_ASM_000170
MEPEGVIWDETESICCWKCQQPTNAKRNLVYPLIIGDKDHLYRPIPDCRYGVVVCVPVLKVNACFCSGSYLHHEVQCGHCEIGFNKTLSAVWWDGCWVHLPDFLRLDGDPNRYLEAAAVLCKERVVAHVLHWFSTTKEERADSHAGFPPPGIRRGCALVCRDACACAYSTFDPFMMHSDQGWRLPTLFNLFVRAGFRGRGCARQLLEAFFRFNTLGK